MHASHKTTDLQYCVSFHSREFECPQPNARIIMDCVTKFKQAINLSLKSGSVGNNCIRIEFRLDVFRLLFDCRGQPVSILPHSLVPQANFCVCLYCLKLHLTSHTLHSTHLMLPFSFFPRLLCTFGTAP